MSIPRSVADVIRNHVTLEVEGIDRMYLNVYQPKLQMEKGAACFFRFHRKQPVASSSLMGVMTNAFLQQVGAFVEAQQIPVVQFRKGQRKDDIANQRRAAFGKDEGIVFIGKAQEKCTVYRTEKRHNARLAGRARADFIALMAELHLPRPKMIDVAVPANQNLGISHAV